MLIYLIYINMNIYIYIINSLYIRIQGTEEMYLKNPLNDDISKDISNYSYVYLNSYKTKL